MQSQGSAGRFRLLDYFRLTSLVAFSIVAIALYGLEAGEYNFFDAARKEQSQFIERAQADLLRQQKAEARASLLMEHEAAHVDLTRVFANSLWSTHFAPLVAEAQKIPLEPCRTLTADPMKKASVQLNPADACFAEIGTRLRALPRFATADAAVHAMMKGSSVFKIKVYDLRGLTVYSSELKQVGEDKSTNKGWKDAFAGRAASELVHRDKFSAFEGEVYNRDLIQTYVPVRADGRIAGVFEIYSDVTPMLKHLEASAMKISDVAALNRAKVDETWREHAAELSENSARHFTILAGLLVGLYAALYLLVRNGQKIIDAQVRAREAAALREQAWHREKMAALATMAANTCHEVGNPLAIISGLAEDIERARASGEPLKGHAEGILAQTARIAEMTRRITQFAAARSEVREALDVNEMVEAVREFLAFDTRYRYTRIEATLADDLPACIGIPDHLNEVLMSLMQAFAEASLRNAASGERVTVITRAGYREVMVRIGCDGGPPHAEPCLAESDARLDSARRRVEGMGGRFVLTPLAVEIYLPSDGAAPSRSGTAVSD